MIGLRALSLNFLSSYKYSVPSFTRVFIDRDGRRLVDCLTHSVKEELEEMKESFVLSVSPEQIIQYSVSGKRKDSS